jgi:hypothetical protein
MRVVRAGVALLAVVETLVGLWTLLLPRSFYDVVPGVDVLPYNEHLMRDYGAMNLALALVTWVAYVRFEVWLARLVLAAYLLFAVPHLIYHQTHLEGLTTGEVLFNVIALWLAVLIPALLLVMTRQVANSSVSPPSV